MQPPTLSSINIVPCFVGHVKMVRGYKSVKATGLLAGLKALKACCSKHLKVSYIVLIGHRYPNPHGKQIDSGNKLSTKRLYLKGTGLYLPYSWRFTYKINIEPLLCPITLPNSQYFGDAVLNKLARAAKMYIRDELLLLHQTLQRQRFRFRFQRITDILNNLRTLQDMSPSRDEVIVQSNFNCKPNCFY